MEKKNVSRTLLHLLFFFACAMWFVAVLVRAGRTEGYQILFSEGRYWDCAQGWYDDEGNVCNIEEYLFTEDDVGKEMIFHYRIPEQVDLVGEVGGIFYINWYQGFHGELYAKAMRDIMKEAGMNSVAMERVE